MVFLFWCGCLKQVEIVHRYFAYYYLSCRRLQKNAYANTTDVNDAYVALTLHRNTYDIGIKSDSKRAKSKKTDLS